MNGTEGVLALRYGDTYIFDVSDGGMPHLVNHVTNPDKKRTAITGWYE